MPNDIYERNTQWLKPGEHSYNTDLGADEQEFRSWVQQNRVPFDPSAEISDYDMRGFYKALKSGDEKAKSAVDPNDQQLHYPDYWKTPYHQTFSAESQWADPQKAPKWNDKDQLVAPDGTVLFDDRAPKSTDPPVHMTNRQQVPLGPQNIMDMLPLMSKALRYLQGKENMSTSEISDLVMTMEALPLAARGFRQMFGLKPPMKEKAPDPDVL